jgi:hypothetical protein
MNKTLVYLPSHHSQRSTRRMVSRPAGEHSSSRPGNGIQLECMSNSMTLEKPMAFSRYGITTNSLSNSTRLFGEPWISQSMVSSLKRSSVAVSLALRHPNSPTLISATFSTRANHHHPCHSFTVVPFTLHPLFRFNNFVTFKKKISLYSDGAKST